MLNFPIIQQSRRLKVGVLLLEKTQPVWVSRILAEISTQSFVDIRLIVPDAESALEGLDERQIKSRTWLRMGLDWLDGRLHARKMKAGDEKRSPLNGSELEEISVRMVNLDGRAMVHGHQAVQKIREAGLDIILYFEDFPVDDLFCGAAVYGLCPFAGEFREWRLPEKVVGFLYNLFQRGSICLARDPYTSTLSPKKNWTRLKTGEFQLVWLTARVLAGKVLNRLFEGIYRERWEIAFRFSKQSILENSAFQPTYRLKPPLQKIFGDPFPITVGGRSFLFFEEMVVDEVSYKLSGHISVAEIDRENGRVGKILPALKRDYHLSFPFIFTWKGEYFMLPETHQNQTIEIYRCLSFPDRWEYCKTLMSGIKAVDVTLFEKDGTWWMFAAIPEPAEKKPEGIKLSHLYGLNIYFSNSPLGEWHPHPQNPVKKNRTSTRASGRIFFHNGDYYRPAQDCTPRYGHAVVFNRIEKLTETEFIETEGTRIIPPNDWKIKGIHTFNSNGGFQAVDFISCRNRFLP